MTDLCNPEWTHLSAQADPQSICLACVYNLNEPDLPIYTGRGWTLAEYDRKIDWTQRIIRLLHPDIFGFQELARSVAHTRPASLRARR